MPYGKFSDGLYLVSQESEAKKVTHYGIMDVGNRVKNPNVHVGKQPVIIHQTTDGIKLNWLQDTGKWTVRGNITDEPYALQRMKEAFKNPVYDLFGNNCEHFARFIATGKKESHQVQAAAMMAGLGLLVFALGRNQ